MGNVSKVKVDMDFVDGFEISHKKSAEEVLKGVLKQISNASFEELEIELEFDDGSTHEYLIGDDVDDSDEEDEDDDDDTE
ncbi:hypothetical protein [Chengkuizengella axinellae]|uniref:Uncharacterized protein n=1 Tax=Chengkuizengella axinellae TaxID=3064388 RepID=A0ABT9J480_9BACL|nr:hypothetical protein [Chengkuizengella sp. 2205SS18-9]MDP5276413.1 hypothetical protein [Chengkuizengella sp. 2205SS18-9]